MQRKSLMIPYSFLASLVALALTWVTSGFQLLSWINHLFLIGLLLLVIAAMIYVIRGGFFDTFAKSMKKVSKINRSPSELDVSDDDFATDETQAGKMKTLIKQLGIICFIAGLLCSLLSFVLLYWR